jgi:hypothetical protein
MPMFSHGDGNWSNQEIFFTVDLSFLTSYRPRYQTFKGFEKRCQSLVTVKVTGQKCKIYCNKICQICRGTLVGSRAQSLSFYKICSR